MAKFPLTSKKLNLAYFFIPALVSSLCCTREWSWHLFSESRQKPHPSTLQTRIWFTRPQVSQHTTHSPSLPLQKEVALHAQLPSVPAWKSCLLTLSGQMQVDGGATAWPKVISQPLYEQGGCWKLEFTLGTKCKACKTCSPYLCTWELLPSKRVFLTC